MQPNTDTHTKLVHFLGCLDVPAVATFRDSPIYSDAIEFGQGVVDMFECRAARKETVAWRRLVDWIEDQQPSVLASSQSIRHRPKAALRHADNKTPASA